MYIPQDLKNITFDIYKRRSSDDADHQVASLESQHEVLINLVKDNKIKIGQIVEESMSAKQPGRPVFNEEIRRIELGEIQGLIIWDLSRASRNPVDSGTLSWLLQKEKLKAIITPHKIYLPEDNVLLLNVEFGMANQYLRDLSRNVKRGMQNKLNNGWRPGIVPEGYSHDLVSERGKKEILTDSVRFPLIRRAWDLLLTGNYTVQQILRIMNHDWGYRTNRHRSLGGKELGKSSIYTIFTNTFYYGEFEYPLNSGKWYEGKHEKMITKAEYDKAQTILGARGKPRPKRKEFAFTGMIRCGECNAMVTAEEKINRFGSRYTYYHCTKRVNKKCGQRSIELDDFEEQVDFLLSRIEIPESFKDWAIKYLNELHDKESKDQDVIVTSVDTACKNCLTKINNLIKLKISPMNEDGSLLSDEDFERQMKPLKQEKKSLESNRQNLGERADKWLELSTKTFNFACYARIRFMKTESLMEKKEILATIGSNFILQDKLLRLTVPKPFIAIQKAKDKVDELIARFEPEEKTDVSSQMMYIYAQNSSLQG